MNILEDILLINSDNLIDSVFENKLKIVENPEDYF